MMFFMNSWQFAHVVGKVDLPNHRKIVVEGQTYHDEGQSLRYSVFDGTTAVVNRATFGFAYGGINTVDFDVLTEQNGNLVLVTDKQAPRVIVFIHDFNTGYSFPAHDNGSIYPDPRAKRLAEVFKKKHPHRRLLFSG